MDIFKLSTKIAERKYKCTTANENIKRKFLKFINNFLSKKKFLLEELDSNKKSSYTDKYFSQIYDSIIFFEGYFETEKYFQDYKNDLIKEFTFKQSVNLKDNIY